MEQIKWVANRQPKTDDKYLQLMSLEEAKKTQTFHSSFPQYSKTPLADLKSMAELLGLGGLFVKDESYRFGLNAFKVLGGSYAIARYIAKKVGKDISELGYEALISEKLRSELGQTTFFTATDGNHGRGVAWAANKLGQKAVVLMPKGTTKTRLENIQKEGADVTIKEYNYDECVRQANALAEKTPNSVVIQDTAWEGYEEIPSWIMQGYGTMAMEAGEQLAEAGQRPTHIFVQAGVGSLAGAVQGYFANLYGKDCPTLVVVESNQADCLYRSAADQNEKIQVVEGDMTTIMAGLACGEPNPISWDILKNHSSFFISCPDWVSAKGMRMLSAPLKGDPQVVSGESGAVSMGLIASIMQDDAYQELRKEMKLDCNSKVLIFSTEGDTDPENYRRIVWNGAFPSVEL